MKKRAKAQVSWPWGGPKSTPPKNASVPKNPTSTSSLARGYIGTFIYRLNMVIYIGIIVGIICATYFAYRLIRAYLLSRKVEPVITLLYPNPPAVGQTITCRIRFRSKEGRLIPFNSKIFYQLKDHIQITLVNDGVEQPVRVLQEVFPTRNHILGKFSVRKSGTYQMGVKYWGWFYLNTSNEDKRFTFEVAPGLPSLKNTDFGTHNPQILCIRAGTKHYLKIEAKDEYGNNCRAQDLDIRKFTFDLHHMGAPVSGDHYHFGLHEPTKDVGQKDPTCYEDDGRKSDDSRFGYDLCLKLRLKEPGIYQCSLKYEQYFVRHGLESQKLLVCMSALEEAELGCIFSQRRFPGTLIYSCECKATKVGTYDKGIEGYVGMTGSTLSFAKYNLALQLYPTYSFPMNGRTKLQFHESRYEFGEVEVSLIVQDGLRQSIQLDLEPSAARKLLVCFAHIQGFIFPKLGTPFSEKRDHLKSKFGRYFFENWFISEKTLRVQHGNLIKSTQAQVPKENSEWLLPFKILFDAGGAPQWSTTSEWLNKLCAEIFTPDEESGMFYCLPGSRLLHPRSSGFSRQPLSFYRLAGQILAKSVVETLLRQVCSNFSDVRLTRSTLAYLLGFPINYKCLETDEPNYFLPLIKPLLEMDVSQNDKNYMFTTLPETPSGTNVVNLVQNGSKTLVTNENKEHYLNMLAHHRLIHPVAEELKQLRSGFYDVINIDHLCDFNETDLEMLICGACPFNIADLVAHHRVIQEFYDSGFTPTPNDRPRLNASKVLNWFWVATANMSEKEKTNLIFFVTGKFSLPACGFGALNPKFSINLTGSFGQPPRRNPANHEIILSDHVNFDNFEKTLLEAITPMSDRLILPVNVDNGLTSYLLETLLREDLGGEEMELDDCDGENNTNSTPPPPPPTPHTVPDANGNGTGTGEPVGRGDFVLTWLKGFANLS